MELKDPAQARYARWLAWGTRLGLALLIATFALYVLGGHAPHVPIDHLPELWKHPAHELLDRVGVRSGWGWMASLPRSDMLVLAAIAVLATCSIPALLATARAFHRSGDRVLVAICVLEVLVLILAASGVLATGH